MNISIKINDIEVLPVKNSVLKYKINSPAFSKQAITGDFSYPLSFANTPGNRKVFKFIDLINLFTEDTELPCNIYIDNILFVEGIFYITKSNNKFVTGNVLSAASYLIKSIEGKTTKDLDLYSQTFSSEADKWNWLYDTVNYSYPAMPVVMFPVLNSYPNTKTVKDVDGNEYTLSIRNYVNGMLETAPQMLEFGYPNQIAFPYLSYIVEQFFSTYGINLHSNVIYSDSELIKLVLLNFIKTNSTQFNLDPPNNTFYLKNHIAKIDLQELLTGINSMIGQAYFFDFTKRNVKSVFLKSLLLPGNYYDWTDKVLSKKEKKYSHGESGFFLFQKFENDEAINNKQSAYDYQDNLTADYTVDSFEDLPASPSEGEMAYVKAEDAWYIYSKLPGKVGVLTWRFITWDFFGYKTMQGKTDKPNTLTTTGMCWYDREEPVNADYDPGRTDNIWMIPQVGLKVIDDWPTWRLSNVKARTVFYRGKVNGKDDQGYWDVPYPFGTSGNKDPQGNTIGTLQLKWKGANGLYKTYWKEWLQFINQTTAYTFEILLSLTDLINIDLTKQIKIGNNFYLIKNITVDLPVKKAATVEMLRI